MKKLILIGLLLLISACQTATPTLAPTPAPTATPPPTPLPVTSTPEPTPTLEPTATPLPRFFTAQFDSSFTGWSILQAGNPSIPTTEIQNGTLRLQMDSPFTWTYALYGAQEYENVHVETEFTNSAMSPAAIGLVCQYSEEHGWFEYNISTDGAYHVLLGRWLDTGVADYLPIVDGTSKEIVQSGITQHMGMNCSPSTLQLFINGTNIRNTDVSSYGLTGGKIGLTAASFENTPVVAVFNSIAVSEP